MLFRPRLLDLRIIGFYTGKLILGIGFAMLLPLAVSLFTQEWNAALDFVIGSSVALAIGYLLLIVCRTRREMGWLHGVLVVPIAWLAAMIFGAVPLYLSGHFASFLDAMFDTMSGFATTGLALIQDLDHLSYGHNFWRHLTMFIGGQGIVVIMLTLMTGGASGIYGMYVGEAREEKILPNLMHTARFIWLVSLIYLGVGTITLSFTAWQIGLPPLRALFHGMTIFIAGFDTGGFSPQSQSILYYHSAAFELATLPFMVAGGINFALHHALFSGNKREVFKNAEVLMLSTTVAVTFAVVAIALSQVGAYGSASTVFRRGFYQLISAHTGTGFMTIYGPQFPALWGPLAMLGLVIAMGLGASVGSTAGGIKALRIVAMLKALVLETKRVVLPPSAVIVERYHHLKKNTITDKLLLNAFLIGSAYVATYIIGAIIGAFFGYPFVNSVFESVSATANVGLTSGITAPSMPNALKVVYIIQMWVGRLEFISIMALIGFMISTVRGK
ncbi:MAG TPA: TrkH family potassium uptake protein [Anaerolineae bacterium]|nr:TrkH family potassium uptake protein [Anaerolineae bacterium]